MVAFNVPANADFSGIKKPLNRGKEEGRWHFEVACGNDAWWSA
ncbi:hypothetical protein GCM10010430_77690 [Kitasatospora cystarginea]|uniref:DUF397 domain-containing protein n=1 Tax=Kitasatospora cystarginea TaxID=58350 RepID=A0ABN3F0E5_9ACTN